VDEGGLAALVEEQGDRVVRGDPDLARDLLVRVQVRRVRQRELVQERPGVGLRVARAVDPDERDLAPARGRDALEDRELRPAGAAPRGPLVDDDRMAAQPAQARP
jgi:hypothetical protein